MSENSKIEWTAGPNGEPGFSFNPWRGCSRVSAGCVNCYAERQARRNPAVLGKWGAGKRVIANELYWQQPLKWNRKAEKEGRRYRVFCGSMMDVFERHDDLGWYRARLWEMIEETPYLDWILLTKRPENARDMLPIGWLFEPQKNVWIGVSVENQETADERIPLLLRIPSAIRFLSCEPLLGPIDLNEAAWGASLPRPALDVQAAQLTHPLTALDWVIVGGESGPKARPMHPDWVRSIREQCHQAKVAFFFKQWGTWAPVDDAGIRQYPQQVITVDDQDYIRVGKKAAGRELDGRTWEEMPA
jgi:protein gp37